jgi:hypothetical protein
MVPYPADTHTLEHVSEQSPPRVTVTLPDGTALDGRLHARRQRADGAWWYQVAVEAPAGAVAPVDGEDYSGVPTTRERAETRYVVDNGLPPVDGKPRLELHVAGCWSINQRPGVIVTAIPDAREARTMLRFEDTVACEVCRPEP